MTYTFDGFNYFVRLQKGEQLVSNLTKLVKSEQLSGAWLSGLGAALWVELGYYDLDKQEYLWKRIDETLEITALSGNVAWINDEPALHIHGSFSDQEMNGYGGHVKELAVGGTCEIFLHLKQGTDRLTRSRDDSIGLNLLDV